MSNESVLDLWREAMLLIATISAPFLITALVVGLVVAVIQTATQLQESILSFVPKLAASLLVIAFAGHWALEKLNRYTTSAFTAQTEPAVVDTTPPQSP
ncbi:MAG: flagellar biosynthetic protein FliQ [Kofleriaceae bacterium]